MTTVLAIERPSATGIELRPPRVNAAGICVRCLTRCNDDPACVAWFASSCWMVCDRCDGTNWIETRSGAFVGCGCWSGLIEGCDDGVDDVLDVLDDAADLAPARTLSLVASA